MVSSQGTDGLLRLREGKASTITGVIARLAAEAASAQQPQPDDGATERTSPSLGTRYRGQVVSLRYATYTSRRPGYGSRRTDTFLF
jgi:hypothetical protein